MAGGGWRAADVSERRFNVLRGEEVVFSPHRQGRTLEAEAAGCPLCPTRRGGAVTEIPVESFEIAVFENRFPSFSAPQGAAEVVVYTDEHKGSFAALPARRAEALMWVWRDRYAELGGRDGVEYVMPFENRGVEVGTTLHHPHGQVYAFPFLPPVPAAERDADRRRGGCTPCDLNEQELAAAERLVYENGSFAAYVPFAARWPYEVLVSARDHVPSLIEAGAAELRDLADALQAVTRGYDSLFGAPFPYILCVHQAPTDEIGGGHLHAELYSPVRAPGKLKHLAGCEQGAGTMLMDVLPEATAAELRTAIQRGA